MVIYIPRIIMGLVLFCTWVMSRQAQSYIFRIILHFHHISLTERKKGRKKRKKRKKEKEGEGGGVGAEEEKEEKKCISAIFHLQVTECNPVLI